MWGRGECNGECVATGRVGKRMKLIWYQKHINEKPLEMRNREGTVSGDQYPAPGKTAKFVETKFSVMKWVTVVAGHSREIRVWGDVIHTQGGGAYCLPVSSLKACQKAFFSSSAIS